MRIVALAAALAALSFTPAIAAEPLNAAASGKDAATQVSAGDGRVLYVCDKSEMTRRAFEREHGALAFVTAEEAAAKGWTGSRCITKSEMRKLRRGGALGGIAFQGTTSAAPIFSH